MPDVICAGQAVLDCITRGRESAPYRPNVYRAESIRLRVGGDAVNESLALAGLGVKVAAVCGLGRDLPGDILVNALSAAGVDTGRVTRLDIDTPVANIQVAADGSRLSVNSDATRLPGYAIDPASLKGARVVSLASLFRPPLEDAETVKSMLRAARAAGAVVCADTKLPLREGVGLKYIQDALPLIDYIFPNEGEAACYTGQTEIPDMARALADMGIRHVVVKAGAAGCCVCDGGAPRMLPAVPVERVVDTTGAGDSFVAGFIAALLRGADFEACAQGGLRQAAKRIGNAEK